MTRALNFFRLMYGARNLDGCVHSWNRGESSSRRNCLRGFKLEEPKPYFPQLVAAPFCFGAGGGGAPASVPPWDIADASSSGSMPLFSGISVTRALLSTIF